jgi:hypothetical protein
MTYQELMTEVSRYAFVYYLSLDDKERANTSVSETKKLLDKIQKHHIEKGEYTVVCYQLHTTKRKYDNYTVCIFRNYMDSVNLQNNLEYIEGIAIQVYQVTNSKYIMIKEKTYNGQSFRCYSGKTPEAFDIPSAEATPIYTFAKKLYDAKTAIICIK